MCAHLKCTFEMRAHFDVRIVHRLYTYIKNDNSRHINTIDGGVGKLASTRYAHTLAVDSAQTFRRILSEVCSESRGPADSNRLEPSLPPTGRLTACGVSRALAIGEMS